MTPCTVFDRACLYIRLLSMASLLVFAFAPPVAASGDLFYFSARDGEHYYELMLIGRQDPGAVQLSWPDVKRGTRLGPTHELTFDRARRRMRLEFENPSDPKLPPTFRIVVDGEVGYVEFGGRRISGRADWTIQ